MTTPRVNATVANGQISYTMNTGPNSRPSTKPRYPGNPGGLSDAQMAQINALISGASLGAGQGGGATAQQQIKQMLDDYGLGALTDWAYGLLTKGYSTDYILAELRNQPAFKERFPAIEARKAAGLPPISPAEYVATERAYDAYMHSAGLTDLYDRKSLYTKWITGDVSPSEAKDRGDAAYRAVMSEPVEVRAEMTRMFGVAAGPAAVAYYLDPSHALPKIQQQLQQAEIGGAAIRSTYGLLSVGEAELLGNLNVSTQQAEAGFGDLARRKELTQALPGEVGDTITRQEQLGAEFGGDAAAQAKFERAAAQRKATASGGAQYRLTQKGVAGLGSTTR